MLRYILWGLLSLSFAISASAQVSQRDLKSLSNSARKALDNGYYEYALEMYELLDSLQPRNAETNFQTGLVYMRLIEHREKSLKYFQNAMRYGYGNEAKPVLVLDPVHDFYESDDLNFNLGRAHHLNYHFEKAIGFYNEFLQGVADKYHGHHQRDIAIVKRFIENCEIGKELIKDTLDVTITNLGGAVNSHFEEIAPVISADEKVLFFTSRRPHHDSSAKDENDMYTESTYNTTNLQGGKWTVPALLSEGHIDPNENESAVAISPDGTKLIMYKNNHHGTGDLYYSMQSGAGWGDLVKLPEGINTKYLENSASISNDKKTLFFTSTRPGGQGGEDIYVAYKDENDVWGNVQNLGDVINTPYDDDAPFIHPDGVSLYFSSKGHSSMGGFDVFKTTFNVEDSTWSEPVNVGYPINTPENDIFFVWSVDGKRAYFSTHREDSFGGEDIYKLEINDHSHDKVPLILISGEVRSVESHMPVGAVIKVFDVEAQKSVGEFKANSITGRYTLILKPGHNYGFTIEGVGYLPSSVNVNVEDKNEYYEKEVNVYLQTLTPGSITRLNNVFYDFNSAVLKESSFTELNEFYQVLKNNPDLMVEIAGHADSIGTVKANQKMSEMRAYSVYKYFRKRGIKDSRIVYKGYGDEFPAASNITNKGRSENRRTEMIIHSAEEEEAWKQGYYRSKKEQE